MLDKSCGKIRSLNNFSRITFGNTKDNINIWIKDSSVINITGGKAADLSFTKFTNIPDIVAEADVLLYKLDRMYLIRKDAGIKVVYTAYDPHL